MVSFKLPLLALWALSAQARSGSPLRGQSQGGRASVASKHAAVAGGLAQTTAIVDAANTFLASLTADQKASILFTYQANLTAVPIYLGSTVSGPLMGEKYGDAVWSNFPVTITPRPGLPLGNMTDAQDAAAMNLLSVMLSEDGYTKIQNIMASDQVTHDEGVPYDSGRDTYTLGIFGEPSLNSTWMVQFGGHHLGMNVAINRDQAVIAPFMTGALPALFTVNNVTTRVLAKENDVAFELINSLTEELRTQATIEHDFRELTLGPGHDGVAFVTEGAPVSDFTVEQQSMVVDLVTEWAGMINPVHYAPRLAEIKAGLNETYFAWNGTYTKEDGHNGLAYFRIKAPNLWVEYAPQDHDGDATLHAHTVYRDQLRGYGRTLDA